MRSLVARAWAAPLGLHLAALAIVLVALIPVVGAGQSFFGDEGAAIIEARSLAAGDGFVVEHPLPEVDPTGASYPVANSDRGADGFAPFAKHPLYALLLAAAELLGGVTAMVVLSVAGTLAAAGMSGALAGRLDSSLAQPTVWAVGVASPLLFDSYLVVAHSLGAALAVGAVLLAVSAVERPSLAAAVGVAPCLAAALLLRTEAVFFALGLLVAAAGYAVAHRMGRAQALVVAGATVVATAASHFGEAAWVRHVLGGAPATGTPVGRGVSVDVAGEGFLAARVHGLISTWLRPSYGGRPLVALSLLVMAAAVIAGTYAARRHRSVAPAAAVAVGAAAVALVAGPTTVVPGLLMAFPVLLAGAVALDRSTFRTPAARLAGVTVAVFVVGVLATQYSIGGGREWGGRYFALALPVAVPLALLALRHLGTRLTTEARRTAVGALVTCSLVMATMAVASLRSTHQDKARLIAAIQRAGQATATTDPLGAPLGAPLGPSDKPVVVTTAVAVPRWSWSLFDDQRWLLVRPDDLDDMAARLGAIGVQRFVLVTGDSAGDRSRLGDAEVVAEETSSADAWRALVVEAR